MANVSTKCDAEEQEDGTWSLVITTLGLTRDEATEIGNAMADPMKIAVLKALKARLKPSSFVTDSRNNEPGSTLQ